MKKIFYSTLALLFILQACSDLENVNENPAGFNTIDPGIQLTKVMVDLTGNRDEVWSYDLGIASPLVQHLAGSWWTQHGGQYRVVEKAHWYVLWESTYPRELKNIQDVIDRTKGNAELVNINSAARILRVYIYSQLTDLYGDIPYSEAIKGYTEKKFLPKYDKQEEIYADFFKELSEAVAALDESKKSVSGDLFFDGAVAKWKRYGNSLRMRLGFRLTKVNEAEAKKQVEAAIAGGVMQSNDDIAMVRHMNISYGGGENRGNGRSQVFKATPNSEGFRLTNTLVDFMKATDDPRLTVYGGTYLEDGTDITPYLQLGTTYGAMWWNEWSDYGNITDDNGNDIYVSHTFKHMQPSKYVTALDAPFFHFTFAETKFLLAEAAARGWGGVTDPEQHFLDGIEASCEMMAYYPGAPAIDPSDIDALKAHYDPFPAALSDRMEAIHEQMWVNFFLNGVEAYSNYRRTGYPELVPFTSVEWYTSGTGGVMPRRFYYPESEAVQNPTNLDEAVARLGGTNDWLKRVWWDKE